MADSSRQPLLDTPIIIIEEEEEEAWGSSDHGNSRAPSVPSSIVLSSLFLLLLTGSLMIQTWKDGPSEEAPEYDHGDHTPNGPRASVPPRGWNSYDSFSWIINEKQFLANAEVLSEKFLDFGYQYAVVDFLWYRRKEGDASVWSPGHDNIDEWGRPVPDPERWPSSAGGNGFIKVAEQVHDLGLKFGIHVMRGISTQAVKANTPILGPEGKPYEADGRIWRAKDIALLHETCGWMSGCFTSINVSTGAGRAFIESLYQLYEQWGVDFVKHDCVYGDDLNIEEVLAVSEILKGKNRTMLYSISPGTHVTLDMAERVKEAVNMYRVTGDDWDSWRDLTTHFDVARDFAQGGYIGDQGLLGRSWPDLDMLPFGWLTDPGSTQGPHRNCSLTTDEQKTQMTLWAMAKSPLFLGSDLMNMDSNTMSIVTNPVLLEIHNNSYYNREFDFIKLDNFRIWIAKSSAEVGYIAFFNLGDSTRKISVKLEDILGVLASKFTRKSALVKHNSNKCSIYDVWGYRELILVDGIISSAVSNHGSLLLKLDCSRVGAVLNFNLPFKPTS